MSFSRKIAPAILLFARFLLSTCHAGTVVGICQSKDKLAAAARAAQSRKAAASAARWNKVREEVRKALKDRNRKMPKSARTLLYRIEAAREHVEHDYFAARRRSRRLRDLLRRTDLSIEQTSMIVDMTSDDLQDAVQAVDPARLEMLGLPAMSSSIAFASSHLDEAVRKRRMRLDELRKRESGLEDRMAEARSACNRSFDYVRYLAGARGRPDFDGAVLKLRMEAKKADLALEAVLAEGERIKKDYLASKAAVDASTSPGGAELELLKSKAEALKKVAVKAQERDFTARLRKIELQELKKRAKLWKIEEAKKAADLEIGRVKRELSELADLKSLLVRYEDLRDDLASYRSDLASLQAKRKDLQKNYEQAVKKEELLERKLKGFVDREIAERRAVEKAEKEKGLVATLLSWAKVSAKSLWKTISNLPFVLAAMAYMAKATPGYVLELVKQIVMFVINVVSDVVFASAPLLGLTVGFLIGQCDNMIHQPVKPDEAKGPAIVLSVSPEAGRYYFKDDSGKLPSTRKLLEMVRNYRKFVAGAARGYERSFERQKKRAEKLSSLCGKYAELNSQADGIRRELAVLRREYEKARKDIFEAEDALRPFRSAAEAAVAKRAELYDIKRKLAGTSSVAEAELLLDRIGTVRAELKKLMTRMSALSAESSFAEAGKRKERALSDMNDLKPRIEEKLDRLAELFDRMEALAADIDVLRSGAEAQAARDGARGEGPGGGTVMAGGAGAVSRGFLAADLASFRPLGKVKLGGKDKGKGKKKPRREWFPKASAAGTIVKWSGDFISSYQAGMSKSFVWAPLLEPFLPDGDEVATQAKRMLSLRAKGRIMVDKFLETVSSEFNDRILPMARGPLALAQSTGAGFYFRRAEFLCHCFGKASAEYVEVRKRTTKVIEALAQANVGRKFASAEAALSALEKTVAELDDRVAKLGYAGGLIGDEVEIKGALGKLQSLLHSVEGGVNKVNEGLSDIWTGLSRGDLSAPTVREEADAVMAVLLKDSMSEAAGEVPPSKLLGGEGGRALTSYFRKNAFVAGGTGRLARTCEAMRMVFDAPAKLVRNLAKSDIELVSGFAKSVQANMTGMYMNLLYMLKDLYSMLDFEDPCFPDQPLLAHDPETGKPLEKPKVVFVPRGEWYEGWIEVHDVTSGIDPLSFSLVVKDETPGSKGPYASGVDLFAQGTKARKALGENPLDESRRGKGLTVLQEEIHGHVSQSGWGRFVSVLVKPLLSLAGLEPYAYDGREALYLENRIRRCRFHFRIALKDTVGHLLRLTPAVRDRAGRPSSLFDRSYLVKLVRDDEHPTVKVVSPCGGDSFKSGTVKVRFLVDDVTRGKRSVTEVSGVPLSSIVVTVLRDGKAMLETDMTGKKPVEGKVLRRGGLVLAPCVFETSFDLPDGEYELRVAAKDRAGNVCINGTAVTGPGTEVRKIFFSVGDPRPAVILPALDPARKSYPPGAEAELSLFVENRTAGSAIEKVEVRLNPARGLAGLERKYLLPWMKGRTFDFGGDQAAGTGRALPEKIRLKVRVAKTASTGKGRKKDDSRSRLVILPFSARIMLSGGPPEGVEADFKVQFEIKGRNASDDIVFDNNICFEDSRGEVHPLPFGTKVGVTHIYEMPLAGLGASGLQSGGSKFVEQYIGFGEVDNSNGHVLCRLSPVGGGRNDRFRVVAHSFAVEPMFKGGKRGIAAVVGLRRKLPFKIVGLPMPARLTGGGGGTRYFRLDSPIVIPGPKNRHHPVPLKYEGCLTTGGFINPWGDMGSGGGARFAMSMTLAGQMASMATMGLKKDVPTTPGLMWRNHSDAFSALASLVKGYRFARKLSRIVVPDDLKAELGRSFIPLLPMNGSGGGGTDDGSSSNADVAAAAGEGAKPGKEKTRPGGAGKKDRNAVFLRSLTRLASGNERLVALGRAVAGKLAAVESLGSRLDGLTSKVRFIEAKKTAMQARLETVQAETMFLKSSIVQYREQAEAADSAGSSAMIASEIARLEALVKARESERKWLEASLAELDGELGRARNDSARLRDELAAARRRYVQARSEFDGVAVDSGLRPSDFEGLGLDDRFRAYADFKSPEEKKKEKRRRRLEFFLAKLERSRLRRRLEKEPIQPRGQTARWWPAGRDGGLPRGFRPFTCYGPDYEGVERILIPPGEGGDASDPYRLLRAYGAYIRRNFIARPSGELDRMKNLPAYDYTGPIRISPPSLAVEEAWDEGFDTFFASAAMDTPYFYDRTAKKKLDYHGLLASMGEWKPSLARRFKRRGLDNPRAVAAVFWLCWERFGVDFMANLLGYGGRLQIPQLASYYPELHDAFVKLGMIPVLTFERSTNGLPVIVLHDNGIVHDCRGLDFVVEYSPDRRFRFQRVTIESGGRRRIDFGKALEPEHVEDVLGNRLEDGTYYFRARLVGSWADQVFGEAYTAPQAFTVKREAVTVDSSGGSVPFGQGTVKGRLDIPAGALEGEVPVSVTPLGLPDDIEGYRVVGGGAFEILPDRSYSKAAEIVFEYDDKDVAGVNERDITACVYDKDRRRFVPLPADIDTGNNRIRVRRRHNSIYALLVDTQPPEIRKLEDGPDPFDPSIGEVIRFKALASEAASFHFRIYSAKSDSQGATRDGPRGKRVLVELDSAFSVDGLGVCAWNGMDSTGKQVADGDYVCEAVAVDASGKKSRPVSTGFSVLTGPGARCTGAVSVEGRADADGVTVSVEGTSLTTVCPADGAFVLERIPPGHRVITARVEGCFPESWDCASLRAGETTSLPGRVISGAVLSEPALSSYYVTPDNDGEQDELCLRFRLSRDVPIDLDIVGSGDRVMASPVRARRMGPGRVVLTWDGFARGRVPVPGGKYRARIWARAGKSRLLQHETEFVLDRGLCGDLFVDPSVFSPNGDGLDDVASLSFSVTSTAVVDLHVTGPSGAVVRTMMESARKEPGLVELRWNGDGDDGRPLPDGTYVVRLSSGYPDGFRSRTFTRELVLDRSKPEIVEMSPMNGSRLTTGMPLFTARLKASPGDVPPGYVKLKIDGHTIEPDVYDPATGRVSYRPATSLGKGSHIAIVYARDLAGNEAEPAAAAFRIDFGKESVDRQGPGIRCISPRRDEKVFTADPSFETALFDAESGVDPDTIELYIDGRRVANSVLEYIPGKSGKPWDMWFVEKMKVLYDPLSGRMRYNSMGELKEGAVEGLHTWRVAVMDRAGNRALEYHGRFEVRLDEDAPVAGRLEADRRSMSCRITDEGPSGPDPWRTVVSVDGKLFQGEYEAWSLYRAEGDFTASRLNGLDLSMEDNPRSGGGKDGPSGSTSSTQGSSERQTRRELRFEVPLARNVGRVTIVARDGAGRLCAWTLKGHRFVLSGSLLREEFDCSLPAGSRFDDILAATFGAGRAGTAGNQEDKAGRGRQVLYVRALRGGSALSSLSVKSVRGGRGFIVGIPAVLPSDRPCPLVLLGREGNVTGSCMPSCLLRLKFHPPLTNGREHLLAVTPFDRAGNRGDTRVEVVDVHEDDEAPTLVHFGPADGSFHHGPVKVEAVFYDTGGSGVDAKGVKLVLDGRRLEPGLLDLDEGRLEAGPLRLDEGGHVLSLSLADKKGNKAPVAVSRFVVSSDVSPPVVELLSPVYGEVVDSRLVRVSARLSDRGSGINPDSVVLRLDGRRVEIPRGAYDTASGRLSLTVDLNGGKRRMHLLTLSVSDFGGNEAPHPAVSVFVTGKGGTRDGR